MNEAASPNQRQQKILKITEKKTQWHLTTNGGTITTYFHSLQLHQYLQLQGGTKNQAIDGGLIWQCPIEHACNIPNRTNKDKYAY